MKINESAYLRTHTDVAAFACAALGRVTPSTIGQVPGDSSVLGTAPMTNARPGSSGWSPPS
jgi:hypothetical protein